MKIKVNFSLTVSGRLPKIKKPPPPKIQASGALASSERDTTLPTVGFQ